MTNRLKVHENRLRRAAQRQDLVLRKSRRRDVRAADFGTYYLIDPDLNAAVGGPFDNLDQVEAALNG